MVDIRKKQVLRLMCIFLVVLMILTGCGSGGSREQGSVEEAITGSDATENNGSDGDGNGANDDGHGLINETGLPILKKPGSIKLKMFWAARAIAPDPVESLWIQENGNQTGVEFEWMKVPDSNANEKINLMLASSDLPDVFFNGIERGHIIQYMDQGLFIPTEELTEKWMPNLQKIYGQHPEYKAMATAPDGHRYGFPYIEEMYGLVCTPGVLYVYKPWLDQLGMSIPTNLDEWVDMLRAFESNDLNNNGKKDEIPLVFQHGGWDSYDPYHIIASCFGTPDPSDHKTLKDGKVICTATTEAMKDTVDFFNKLYKEGLIDQDSFNPPPSGDPRGNIQAKLNSEEVTVGCTQSWIIAADVYDPQRRDEYVALPQLEGPRGKMGVRNNNAEMHSATRCVITTACEYPEVVARWVDHCYEPEQSVLLNWGALDYVYKKDNEGVLRWDVDENGDTILKDGLNTMEEMRFWSSPVTGALAVLEDYYDVIVEYPRDAQRIIDDQKVQGKDEIMDNWGYIPPLWLLPEEQEKLAQIEPQIYNIINANIAKWMVDGGVEQEWDNYLSELIDAGLEDWLKIYQQAYDRYAANLK